MRSPPFTLRSYAVLAALSGSYPPLKGTFRCVTHPFATRHQTEVRAAVRLACVRHAASVQSEPGSNSSVQSLFLVALDSSQNFRFNLYLVRHLLPIPLATPNTALAQPVPQPATRLRSQQAAHQVPLAQQVPAPINRSSFLKNHRRTTTPAAKRPNYTNRNPPVNTSLQIFRRDRGWAVAASFKST